MPSDTPLPGKCGSPITKWKIKYDKIMYCTNTAGKGTDHKGTGRCKLHGGSSTGRNGITRTLKESKKQVIKAILHGEIPGYQEFTELPPHLKYDLDLELYGGKQVAEATIKKLLDSKDMLDMSEDSIKLVAGLTQLLIAISEHNRRNVDTQFKIKYSDVSKFQVQFIHRFIEILIIKALNDDTLGLNNSAKQAKFREIITESLEQCARQGDGKGSGAEPVEYQEVGPDMENRTS